MPALDRIEVKGFKSIREMNLELRPLNVLIGANGSGKSNFISVFRLLNAIAEKRLQLFVGAAGGADTLLHFGRRMTAEIRVNLDFESYSYDLELAPSSGDSLFFSQEILSYRPHTEDGIPGRIGWGDRGSLGEATGESRLEEWSRNPRQENKWFNQVDGLAGNVPERTLNALKSWKVYHFNDTSENAKVKLTGKLDDNFALRPDASNLAAYVYLLRERYRPYYDRIVKTIRLAAPFFDDFILEPQQLNPDTIQLKWREKGSDADFYASALSDGTLRFMCLATLLLQPTLPTTILIDEPELGLHPYAITFLGGMLRSAATQTQVIISTQSVPFVNQFAPEDVIVVDRENEQSVFKHLDVPSLEQWLENYSLGELWEKNVIGGTP